eukprot:Sspe_Gene.82543::Locus_54100_Transcript_1_1_Confidence_1.000_Length_1491::g.82543::m.82543
MEAPPPPPSPPPPPPPTPSLQKPMQEIPHMNGKDVTPATLAQLTHPVIITGLIDSWPLYATCREGKGRKYIADRFGNIQIALMKLDGKTSPAYADHVRNAYVRPVKDPEPIRLAAVLEGDKPLTDHVFVIDEEGPGQKLLERGDIEIPQVLAAEPLTLRRMDFSIGPDNDGVMMHTHGATWLAILSGKKRWYFFPPDGFKGRAYDELALLPSCKLTEGVAALPQHLRPIEVIQETGEVMFLPDGWWHSTVNIGETMMVGGQRKETADTPNVPRWATAGVKRWPKSGILQQLVADGYWKEYCRKLAEMSAENRKDGVLSGELDGLRREALYHQAVAWSVEPYNFRFGCTLLEMAGHESKVDPVSVRSLIISMVDTARRAHERGWYCDIELAQLVSQVCESAAMYVNCIASVIQMQSMVEAGRSSFSNLTTSKELPSHLTEALREAGLQ